MSSVRIIRTGDMLALLDKYPQARGAGYMLELCRLGTEKTTAELENMPYHQFMPLVMEVLAFNRLVAEKAQQEQQEQQEPTEPTEPKKTPGKLIGAA